MKVRAAYLHLIGGVSGDMLLAALVDAGLPLSVLEGAFRALGVGGWRLETTRAQRGGVVGTHLRIQTDSSARVESWDAFRRILTASTLPRPLVEKALAALERLEQAEAHAHRQPRSHLHELGNLDTLLDIVGVVVGLAHFGVERVYASPLPVGSGLVRSEHGLLPVPAPATLALIAMAQAPVVPPSATEVGELVTPTGAALVTTLATFTRPIIQVERYGYGLGTREVLPVPNALAIWMGTVEEEVPPLVLLETNIDDMNPQLFGYVQERLFALGARDVWLQPLQMKKGRPGVLLSALVPAALEAEAVALLFRETTTLGVRTRPVYRHEAQREIRTVSTSLGAVPVKVKVWEGRPITLAPEYEACKRIAQERGLPLQQVMRQVAREAEQALGL
ncbi:MAG: nickel pincer cofactor biosynthesis protein LarC [Dehalococcoidia bacterium]|nr:nickel pincer cofactor biosynthesis protein LarC [Dehalococcoidia bacterium]MDW8120270.1 nickel pincer cofactor biosynthesis protein LarC [Chloroflexota bacterium]